MFESQILTIQAFTDSIDPTGPSFWANKPWLIIWYTDISPATMAGIFRGKVIMGNWAETDRALVFVTELISNWLMSLESQFLIGSLYKRICNWSDFNKGLIFLLVCLKPATAYYYYFR